MTPASRPCLPRGVRLHHDRVRDLPVLLGPETVLTLEGPSQVILSEIDGQRDVATIAGDLARRYDAPVDAIEADMLEFLSGLVDRRLVDLA